MPTGIVIPGHTVAGQAVPRIAADRNRSVLDRDLIRPNLDELLEKQVLDKTWLPEVRARSRPNGSLPSGSRALQ
jgi:hypothetical protein